MNPSLQLVLDGPYRLCSSGLDGLLSAPAARASGVYLYARELADGRRVPTYVGETGVSFQSRCKTHIINGLGGYDRVYEPVALSRGEKVLVWGGLWQASRQGHFQEFMDRYLELAPFLLEEVKSAQVFLLPLAQDIDRRVRRRIEGALAAHLLAQPPPVRTMMAEGVRYSKGLRKGEVPIEVIVEEHERLLGVPERIWV